MEIAVISGKGGTGKSSISAAFATMEEEVVIADCDVDAANLYLLFNPSHEEEDIYIGGQKAFIDHDICTNCGLCIGYCRFDAIALSHGRVEISEISCDGCVLCSRICPVGVISMVPSDKSRLYSGSFRNGKMVYGRLAPGEENSGKLVNMVREKARKLSDENRLERIILDGPPGIGCPVISTITGVSKVIVVTEPTLSGLHDMKRALEVVQKFGIKPTVIVNKYDLNPAMTGLIREWCRENSITVAGLLPFEPEVVEAMMQGKSITEFNPQNRISIELKSIWEKILIEK
jgi:MinD superfamily P-loop ATPase